MARRRIPSQVLKSIVAAALAELVVLVLFWSLGAAGCQTSDFFWATASEMLGVLSPVALAAWQTLQACVVDNPHVLQYLLKVLVLSWPLFVVLAAAV